MKINCVGIHCVFNTIIFRKLYARWISNYKKKIGFFFSSMRRLFRSQPKRFACFFFSYFMCIELFLLHLLNAFFPPLVAHLLMWMNKINIWTLWGLFTQNAQCLVSVECIFYTCDYDQRERERENEKKRQAIQFRFSFIHASIHSFLFLRAFNIVI